MPQNFTLDDTHDAFKYSSDWHLPPTYDANFLLGTYHAAQTPSDTCTITLTFNGSAVWLFGSKGPNHGTYSVQVDNTVKLFDAKADHTQYRQLLFGATGLGPGVHEVTLTSTIEDPQHVWLDFDYGIIEVDGGGELNTAGGSFATTLNPESLSSTPTLPVNPVVSPTGGPSPTSATTKGSASAMLPTILAAVLGALLAVVFLTLMIRRYLNRRARRIRQRERDFRLGPSTSPGPPLTPNTAQYSTAPLNPPPTPGTADTNLMSQAQSVRLSIVPSWANIQSTFRLSSPPTRYSRHLPNTPAAATMAAYRRHSQYLEPNSPNYASHQANPRRAASPTSPAYLSDKPDYRHSLDFLSVRS